MEKNSFEKLLVAFILFIFCAQSVATYFFLYWRLWWFDIMMHFVCGLWLTFCVFWLTYLSGRFRKRVVSTRQLFFSLILATIFIGLAWEFFEMSLNIFVVQEPFWNMEYIIDTSLDLLMDTLGAITASLLITRTSLFAQTND